MASEEDMASSTSESVRKLEEMVHKFKKLNTQLVDELDTGLIPLDEVNVDTHTSGKRGFMASHS